MAYNSTGQRRYNQPFSGIPYGPVWAQGDVIGVGYRPRTGTVFFTRNGKKLEDVAHNLKSQNLFPAVGANGPCTVHVNFGQSGFVFIEANVKKWGLAPMTGSLAPPPPYGSEQGSVLLEAGRDTTGQSSLSQSYFQHGRTRSGNLISSRFPPTSPGPVRSPTDISLAHLQHIPSNHHERREDVEDPNDSSPVTTRQPVGAQHHAIEGSVGLALEQTQDQVPPPDYTSPEGSEDGRGSEDSVRQPLIRPRVNPPIPSYSDAVAAGSARHDDLD